MLSLKNSCVLLLVVLGDEFLSFVSSEEVISTDRSPPGTPTAVIAPGVEKPVISLGTGGGMVGDRSVVEGAVTAWLSPKVGGKGVDTAIDYGNDDLVGAALETSDIPRHEVFLTTKQPGPIGYNETIEALRDALVRLRTTYVDLYLIHFPEPLASDNDDADDGAPIHPTKKTATDLRQETWKGMEEVLRRGWARSIGVSNYEIHHLEETLEIATVLPAVNQVLWNPVSHDDALLEFCQAEGITLEAWSPLGGHDSRHGEVLDLPTMKDIAVSHGVSTAQVALRWTLQHGMTLATGTTKEEHMQTDLEVFGFQLTDDEVARISNLQNGVGTTVRPLSSLRGLHKESMM